MNRSAESVIVRAMIAGDLDRVLEIANGLDTAPQWPRATYEAMLEPSQDSSASSRRIALVAVDAGAGFIAGFLVASLIPPEAELETVGVAVESRRRGIGRRLLADLEEKLGLSEVTKVLLEVRKSNGLAREFYVALGFVEAGQRRGYYADPVEDAVVMERSIKLDLIPEKEE